MAGRFPGASSVRELWGLLREGREAVRWLTDDELRAAGVSEDELADPNYVRAALPLPDMEMFDAEFFGFSPKEAAILDPQHRHFLECCWEAFEDAAHDPRRFEGAIGVFAGAGMHSYFALNILSNADLIRDTGLFLLRHTGNDKDFLTTRASYLLNLQGPSVAIQTACSTSLVAVHTACQSLLSGECDMALAGGVTIELPAGRGYRYTPGEILSKDGHCRAFDKDATGTLFGSGAGVVVLRRLEDALADGDHIRAVILGTAVNNDGSRKAGYLAPSVDGQAQAAIEALAIADIDPSTIDYVEAHGTGTLVGDPIELQAMSQAYGGTQAKQFCGVGSIKTNIGHLDTAAGVAGLIKVALALEHGEIPASLNYEAPNPHFDLASSPFYVTREAKAWPRGGKPRRAAVNSVGVGGTNAHIIVEEVPDRPRSLGKRDAWTLFTLSAKSETALDRSLDRWADYVTGAAASFDLHDAAYTTRVGRRTFEHRCAIVARDLPGLGAALRRELPNRVARGIASTGSGSKPEVVFMFPGGGAQFPGAGRELYEQVPAFRQAVQSCFEHMPATAPRDLHALMLERQPTDERAAFDLQDPRYGLPALFVLEYALARMWMSWGVRPAALIGHSAGEYAAAAIAGVMSLADALSVVCLRSELFGSLPRGAMTAVDMSPQELLGIAGVDIDIAAVNAPAACVASGPEPVIEMVEQRLSERGRESQRLRIAVAAHSRALDGVLNKFRARLAEISLSPPEIPIVSNLTGGRAMNGTLASPEYWVRHLRETVRFGDGIREALSAPNRILLETGPGQTLVSLARLNALDGRKAMAVVTSTPPAHEADSELASAYTSAGRLWAHGVDVDFAAMPGLAEGKRIPVPTYAFDRRHHWIEPGAGPSNSPRATRPARLSSIEDWLSSPQWAPTPLPASAQKQVGGGWLVFADEGPLSEALHAELVRRGVALTVVTSAECYARTPGRFQLRPGSAADYERLFTELAEDGALPETFVHLWSLSAPDKGSSRELQTLVFDSALQICRRLQLTETGSAVRLQLVTQGAFAVDGEPVPHPERAALLGPTRVAPLEIPSLRTQLIDVDIEAAAPEMAEALLTELAADLHDDLVALRRGERWTQSYRRKQVNSAENLTAPGLSRSGVHVITGGLGDIGLALADYLAQPGGAKLALLGRSSLPPRAGWSEILRQQPHSVVAQKIRAVTALERLGAELLLMPVDVADERALGAALDEVRRRFGRIDSVFHTAGVLRDAPMFEKGSSEIDVVMGPKLGGARALAALIPDGSVGTFAVFSSTSVVTGVPGQVDYIAANAAAAAIAEARSDGLVVDWGAWSDIGMAARAYGYPQVGGAPTGHPLLGRRCELGSGSVTFLATYSPTELWCIAEHVVAGTPTLPGTVYLEILHAAARQLMEVHQVSVQNLSLVAPMTFHDDRPRCVRIDAFARAGGWDVRVASSPSRYAPLEEHARGFVAPTASDNLERIGVAGQWSEVRAAPPPPQEHTLRLGSRWRSARAVRLGDGEAEVDLQLSPAFEDDLQTYSAHPALYDVAFGAVIWLLGAASEPEGVYVPISIEHARLLGPLTRRGRAVARLTDQSPGMAMSDVDVFDQDGALVAMVRGLAYRKIAREAMAAERAPVAATPVASGIRASEAPAVFDRLFRTRARRVAVSATPLTTARRAPRPTPPIRTVSQDDSAAPSADPIEAALAEMWRDLLGVGQARPTDDFFGLGGHSLIAVRLFNRMKNTFKVDLPLAALFKSPRLDQLAKLVRDHLGPVSPTNERPADAGTVEPDPSITSWSPLVLLRPGDSAKPPFFLLPGGDGGYFKLSKMAPLLKGGRGIYVIRMRGLEDKQPPHGSIEEMAECYATAMSEVWPSGPYRLAGFSGGGVVAYEVAQRLTSSGKRVDLLAMFDTTCPDAEPPTPLGRIWNMRLWTPAYIAGVIRYYARVARQRLGLVQRETERAATPEPVADLSRYLAMFDHYLKLQANYSLDPYDGSVLLFRASSVPASTIHGGRTLGWRKWVRGGVKTFRIHSNHHTMLLPPAIEHVARILDARLDALDTGLGPDGDSVERP